MSKYLTFDERLEIQKGLKYQMSFGEIAKFIGKDRTTVAKEIKRYSYEQKTGYSSSQYQKGACEVNHELIRRIIPKGTSLDNYTQDDIFLMMDHINSYKRKKLNNRSPYDAFSFYYGEDVLKRLACKPVAAENIILKPRLLKK